MGGIRGSLRERKDELGGKSNGAIYAVKGRRERIVAGWGGGWWAGCRDSLEG